MKWFYKLKMVRWQGEWHVSSPIVVGAKTIDEAAIEIVGEIRQYSDNILRLYEQKEPPVGPYESKGVAYNFAIQKQKELEVDAKRERVLV